MRSKGEDNLAFRWVENNLFFGYDNFQVKGVTMVRLVEVKAKPGYRLWLRYEDGVEGEVDLSSEVGKGVFVYWNDYKNFEKVYIGESGQLSWSDELDICPDAMYLELTGQKPEDVFQAL